MDVPAEVENKEKDKDKDKDLLKPEKSKKKAHKSCKDGSNHDSKQKKRHCSPSPVKPHQITGKKDLVTNPVSSSASGVQDITKPPVPAKPVTSVQDSSGPEPSLQTFAKPSTSQRVSTVSHATAPSIQDFSSFYPTGAEDFN